MKMKNQCLALNRIIFLLFVVFLPLTQLHASQDADELIFELKRSKGSEKYQLYKKVIGVYYTRNIDSARIFAKQYLAISTSNKAPDQVASAYKYLGATYFYEGDLANAEKYFTKSLEIASRNRLDEQKAAVANNLGIVKTQKGEYEEAIKYYNQALEYYETKRKSEEIGMIVLNIGNIHYNTEDFEKALEYFLEVVEIASQNGVKPTLAMAYNNIGNIYEHMDSLEKSLKYHELSYQIKLEFNDKRGIANSLNSMAAIHRKMKDNKEALKKAKLALKYQIEINDNQGIITSKNTIGKIYFSDQKPDSGVQYLQESLNLSENLGFFEYMKDNLLTLSDHYEKTGNFEDAHKFYKRYIAVRDSIMTIEEKRSLTESAAKFETDQMKKVIKHLQEESKSKETIQLMLIVFIFLVIFVAFIIYLQFRTKAKANEMLEEKTKEIEHQKKEFEQLNSQLVKSNNKLISLNENLLISQKELKETNATKDKFFSIIAHDLKNSIAAFLTSSELITHYYDKLDKERILHQLNRMNSGAMNLRMLLENLIQWANSKTGRLKPDFEEIDIKKIVDQSVSINEHGALNKSISITKNLAEGITGLADPNMLKTVIRNLISNAIKFTEIGGTIDISSKQVDNKIIISIKDSGVGMSRQEIDMLFKLESNFKKKGTNNEAGTGLGLIICKEFVEYNKGSLIVDSEIGKGSRFDIILKEANT
jgi:signal transduction histidine kinase